jgi:hypothetical protein
MARVFAKQAQGWTPRTAGCTTLTGVGPIGMVWESLRSGEQGVERLLTRVHLEAWSPEESDQVPDLFPQGLAYVTESVSDAVRTTLFMFFKREDCHTNASAHEPVALIARLICTTSFGAL